MEDGGWRMEDGGWRMCPPLESEESVRPVCLTGTVTCQVLRLTMWRVRGMVAALVPPCTPGALHPALRVVGRRSRSRGRGVARRAILTRASLGAPYTPLPSAILALWFNRGMGPKIQDFISGFFSTVCIGR